MKTLLTCLALFASVTSSAMSCTIPDFDFISNRLQARYKNTRLSSMDREAAFSVINLISSKSVSTCDKTLGISGNNYTLTTNTHTILIGFAGSDVSTLTVKRNKFY